jgi:hypothetical protein
MALGKRPEGSDDNDLTDEEKRRLADARRFRKAETGYQGIQGTKPQTLGYGLNDSPAGLAAWIVEKFRTWSDCNGDVESRFTKDEVITNITIYWARFGLEQPHPLAPGKVARSNTEAKQDPRTRRRQGLAQRVCDFIV